MSKIAEEHASLSTQITADFQAFRRALDEREASLNTAVDERHWEVTKKLEKIKERAQEDRGQVAISQRLASSLRDTELPRVLDPISNAMEDCITNAGHPMPACDHDIEYYGFCSIAGALGSLRSRSAQDNCDIKDNPISCLQFETMRKETGIKLSNNSQRAATAIKRERKKRSDGSSYHNRQGICGAGDYNTGVVRFRVQLSGSAKNHRVGIAPRHSPLPFESGFLGWGDHGVFVK